MKKYWKWLVGAGVMLLVVLGLTLGSGNTAYAEIKSEADYEEVMAEEEAYVYFGRDSCPYCRAFKPLLEEGMKKTGTKVYYYDTDAHKDDDDFQDILDAHEVQTVPKLVRLQKGKVVDYVDHTHSQEEVTALLNGE